MSFCRLQVAETGPFLCRLRLSKRRVGLVGSKGNPLLRPRHFEDGWMCVQWRVEERPYSKEMFRCVWCAASANPFPIRLVLCRRRLVSSLCLFVFLLLSLPLLILLYCLLCSVLLFVSAECYQPENKDHHYLVAPPPAPLWFLSWHFAMRRRSTTRVPCSSFSLCSGECVDLVIFI